MMGVYFTLGSMVRDSCVAFGSTEWHAPSRIRRYGMKVAIIIACLWAEVIVMIFMDIKGSEALLRALLMLFPFGFVAGIFIKFRNFSWWRNCRFSRWFY
jgi:hypothetical protein